MLFLDKRAWETKIAVAGVPTFQEDATVEPLDAGAPRGPCATGIWTLVSPPWDPRLEKEEEAAEGVRLVL
ncbi:hypothetical protein QJS10_CPB18g01766 [Acorus calamus]|uniref:Uncharacterized protein n=1 Tax=Acorus calamus TaxID=4465 RepID=A0AAV9CM80_ACOCL|nr:hypothetical protein QJS10_CPB18g01766 [Acorus calamus]